MIIDKPTTIDEYILGFPAKTQLLLKQMRSIIKLNAPDATELLSYGMPAFKLNKILVWFAAHKNHIGLYPKATPIIFFKEELEDYQTSKGAIQFPYDKPLPVELIEKIIKFRVDEIKTNIITKTKKK